MDILRLEINNFNTARRIRDVWDVMSDELAENFNSMKIYSDSCLKLYKDVVVIDFSDQKRFFIFL